MAGRLPRRRNPAPLIPWRLPSGRGAAEQPNTANDEGVRLTALLWFLVVVTGVAAGLFGDLMMWILAEVEHAAYGYHRGDFESAVLADSGGRRLAALAAGGLLAGVAWYLLRRFTAGRRADLDDAVWSGNGDLSARRGFLSAVISEVAVGSGASIGREAAPKLLGGVAGSVLARWCSLEPAQRRLLIACGGGAGMAAVYNVPVGGALVTAELLYGSLSIQILMPALLCSAVATATSWLTLADQPTYPGIPTFRMGAALFVFALILGPVTGLLAVVYVRLIGWVSFHRLGGAWSAVGPLAGFSALGIVALSYPQLLGNGKDMARDAFLGHGTITLLLVLAALKPLVTSVCLGSGATGGLFTPTFSTGAVLGGGLGLAWSHLWAGTPTGAYALVGASALLGAGTQAPISSLVLILELVRNSDSVVVAMVVATALATVVARRVDGYSIYTARLPAHDEG